MKPTIYPIGSTLSVRLAIVARPRGGDWLADEIRALADEKINILVSLLTEEEAEELGLAGEHDECSKAAIKFVNVPVPDRAVPTDSLQFLKAVAELAAELRIGRSVGIHCRACIGRSSLLAASLLTYLGVPSDDAFRSIELARGCPVPDTPEQKVWVQRHASQAFPKKPPRS